MSGVSVLVSFLSHTANICTPSAVCSGGVRWPTGVPSRIPRNCWARSAENFDTWSRTATSGRARAQRGCLRCSSESARAGFGVVFASFVRGLGRTPRHDEDDGAHDYSYPTWSFSRPCATEVAPRHLLSRISRLALKRPRTRPVQAIWARKRRLSVSSFAPPAASICVSFCASRPMRWRRFIGILHVRIRDFEAETFGLGDLQNFVDQAVEHFLARWHFLLLICMNLVRCSISSAVIGWPLTKATICCARDGDDGSTIVAASAAATKPSNRGGSVHDIASWLSWTDARFRCSDSPGLRSRPILHFAREFRIGKNRRQRVGTERPQAHLQHECVVRGRCAPV